MRIDRNSASIKPRMIERPNPASSKRSNETNRDLNGPHSSVDVKSIDGLKNIVADASEVREAVVNNIKAKIQSGEYLTRSSADETASAILDL